MFTPEDSNAIQVLKEIAENLQSTKLLTPLNLSEARTEFLVRPDHNPQIEYAELPLGKFQDLQYKLKNIESSSANPLVDWWLKRKAQEVRLQLEMLQVRGKSEMSEVSQELFGCHFSPEYLEVAAQHAALPQPFVSQEDKNSSEIVNTIQDYLRKYQLHDWQVILSGETDFYFRVRAHKKQVLIGERFNWDFTNLDMTLAHEIDGHVIRAVNASSRKNPLLQKPLPFYIKTEEGLASFLGDFCSPHAEISLKHHALKYLAGELAQTTAFKEVYEFLVAHGFTPDLAFQRTFRLKRGFSDTSIPGCFAKEAGYYEGMLEVKEYLDNGGDVVKLLAAKVGLEDIQFVEETEAVIIPERIQNYLKDRKQV